MKNNHQWQWAITLSSSIALCGALAAQAPTSSTPQSTPQSTPKSPPQRGQPTPGRPSAESADSVTATGCEPLTHLSKDAPCLPSPPTT